MSKPELIKPDYTKLAAELAKIRRLPLFGEMSRNAENTTGQIPAAIVAMEQESSERPITLIIDSAGGQLGLESEIIGAISASRCPIHTLVFDVANSAAVNVLVAGKRRFAVPTARLLIHHTGYSGRIPAMPDIRKHHATLERQTRYLQKRMERYLAKRTGLTANRVKELCLLGDRYDLHYIGEQLVGLGFVDEILTDFKLLVPHIKLEPWHSSFEKKKKK